MFPYPLFKNAPWWEYGLPPQRDSSVPPWGSIHPPWKIICSPPSPPQYTPPPPWLSSPIHPPHLCSLYTKLISRFPTHIYRVDPREYCTIHFPPSHLYWEVDACLIESRRNYHFHINFYILLTIIKVKKRKKWEKTHLTKRKKNKKTSRTSKKGTLPRIQFCYPSLSMSFLLYLLRL